MVRPGHHKILAALYANTLTLSQEVCQAIGMTNTTGTSTYQVGDKVRFLRPTSRTEQGTFTITALTDTGLRAHLNDANGVDLGWAVNTYELAPTEPAGIVAEVEQAVAADTPHPLYLHARAAQYIVLLQQADSGVYQVSVNSGGAIAKYDTEHGDGHAIWTRTDKSAAHQLATAITKALREGLHLATLASLIAAA